MKKYLPHIFIVALILGWTGVFGVEVVQAQGPTTVPTIIANNILAFIGNQVLQIMSLFVWISGLLLDYSLQQTLNIASLVNSIPAIETGWKVFRDLCTMFFIFILLYTAITTILGVGGGKENAKKVITSVVVAGLLINFSLFFTKVVVDTSNLVSLSFYKALVPNPDSINPLKERTGLSAIFMQSLYIQTVYDPGKTSSVSNDNLSGVGFISSNFKILINAVMGSIVMLVASIVFLAASFFFIARLVILILLMVTSPIAFAGEVLGGKVASQSKRWREALIDQCLFMPAYLAVTYVGIKIIASTEFQNAVNASNGSFSGAVAGGSIGVIFNYLVVIVFLMASLILAKEFGVKGADTFNNMAEGVLKAIPNSFAKNTAGRLGANLDKSLGNTWAGNTSLGRVFRENTVGALAKNKFGGERSFKDEKDRGKENDAKKRQLADNTIIRNGSGAVADRAATVLARIKAGGPAANASEQADIDAVNAAETALNKMSGSEITEQTPVMLTQNAAKLNDTHMKAIIKSDKITDADKEKILTARFKELDDARKAVPPDPTKIKEAVKKLSKTDIENLGYDRLRDPSVIAALSSSQMKSASESENYSKTQQAEFKALKIQPLLDTIRTQKLSIPLTIPNPSVRTALTKTGLGAEDISNLNISTLNDLAELGSLPATALPEITKNVVDPGQRIGIKDKIIAAHPGILGNALSTGIYNVSDANLNTLPPEGRAIYKFFKGPLGDNFTA